MNKYYVLSALLINGLAQAELVGLDETSLENVSGQTGIGINFDKIISIDSLTYSDDDGASGGDLQFQDIKIGNPGDITGATAHSEHLVNVDAIGGLFIHSRFEATRFQIGGISVGSHIGNTSFGQYTFDFEGTNVLQIGGATPSGFLINSTTSLSNVDLVWSTNGASFHLDNLTIDRTLSDAVFEEKDLDGIGGGQTGLVIDISNYSSTTTIGGVCFSSADCAVNESFGSFSRELNLINSQIQIHGGGREGEGVTMNMYFEFDEDVNLIGDGNHSSYTDDSTVKLAKQSGNITVTGFTFDIDTAEPQLGDHIAMQWDQVKGNFKIGSVEIAGTSMGSVEFQFDFVDATHDATLYQNKLLMAPGIAFAGAAIDTGNANFNVYMTDFYSKVNNTSDGISLFNEWNMTADILYTDDGNTIVVDNYQNYGNGYTTLDVRTGNLSIDNTNDVNESFLAVGVRDYKVHYSFDGLKMGSQDAQNQNGYEWLGISPEAEFTMNAVVEIRGGGNVGSGVTFDGDVLLSDANFAVTKTNLGAKNVGVYLDDASYEFHFRDLTLDVENEGIKLLLGELWSEFTIEDVRFGDKYSGNSVGGFIIQRYQTGSEVVISAGGAVGSCMDGAGVDAAACDTNGGYWLDTDGEGLTVASKQILQKRNGTKENSVTYVTGRTVNDNGTVGNEADDFYEANTGLQMKVDNMYTTDGYNGTPTDTNTYGIQSTMSVDVAKTRVLKKNDGADANGILGNKGDELVSTGSGVLDYVYVGAPTAVDKTNRPTGLILTSNTRIKELNIESIQLIHPNALATPATLIHGVSLQNLNLSSTLSVTPIR
jgi:hypothetical protein